MESTNPGKSPVRAAAAKPAGGSISSNAAAIHWPRLPVPGVAFDREGGRLGYGGGFFDRLLPSTRTGVARIAGAFDVQIVDRVPRGPQDLAVDCVVTPTSVIHRGV